MSILTHHALEGVTYSYLTQVWKCTDQLILSSDPHISTDPIFSFLMTSQYPHIARQIISTNMTWDLHYGYPLWHPPKTGASSDPQTLFTNTAICHILHQLLINIDSHWHISFPEIRDHPYDHTQLILANPMLFNFPQKIAFALSWVII